MSDGAQNEDPQGRALWPDPQISNPARQPTFGNKVVHVEEGNCVTMGCPGDLLYITSVCVCGGEGLRLVRHGTVKSTWCIVFLFPSPAFTLSFLVCFYFTFLPPSHHSFLPLCPQIFLFCSSHFLVPSPICHFLALILTSFPLFYTLSFFVYPINFPRLSVPFLYI